MKTINEINEKIKNGKAVVLTAGEVKKLSEKKKASEIAKEVDVVTTATFSPMCSSGIFINVGHTKPPMKMQKARFDGVPAYGGIAAVDLFLGVTEESEEKPKFGGAHVIHKLIKGEKVKFSATGKPTDCYPGSEVEGWLTLDKVNQAYFFNPRNCYQNYNAAANSSEKTLQTYMGVLKPDFGSVNFSTTGEFSPLHNDPELKTIGMGTEIFFCGGKGYIAWEGTQFNGKVEKDPETGVPLAPAATLGIIADLRECKPEFVRPMYIPGYGVTISISMGVPIPITDEDIARKVTIKNRELRTRLVDYATGKEIRKIDYEELCSRKAELNGKKVPTRTFTDLKKSMEIMEILKKWIIDKKITLREPVAPLPFHGRQEPFRG